jgi:hypothetical protein
MTTMNIMTIDDAINYLNRYNFREHPGGSTGLYGLNLFDYESTIQFHDDLWRFIWFKPGTQTPMYVNKKGEILEIDLRKTHGIKRMEAY